MICRLCVHILVLHNLLLPIMPAAPQAAKPFIQLFFKAAPHKIRLTVLHVICLRVSHHFAQKILEMRQRYCAVSVQFDEKSDCASDAQFLCAAALNLYSF